MPILVAGLRDHSHLKSADAMFDAMPLTIFAGGVAETDENNDPDKRRKKMGKQKTRLLEIMVVILSYET